MQNHSYNKLLGGALATLATVFFSGVAYGQDAKVTITTGNPDGKLGALSRPASSGKQETEAADDFVLPQLTVISGASIKGLIPTGTPLANIANVEVEIYHIFPKDLIRPFTGTVPSRTNSPSDFEIGSATRDSSKGNLSFRPTLLDGNFIVQKTVVNNVSVGTHGEPSETGQEVEIDIAFTNPIILPAGHYFFRPEVLVTDGDFLFLSAPRPIVAPGIAIPGDLQAWIRNSDLKPDWLRIGTDIIGGSPLPTFNMTFSLNGVALLNPGTPGQPNCHGETVSGLNDQFGSVAAAATALRFSSVDALQGSFRGFCEQ